MVPTDVLKSIPPKVRISRVSGQLFETFPTLFRGDLLAVAGLNISFMAGRPSAPPSWKVFAGQGWGAHFSESPE